MEHVPKKGKNSSRFCLFDNSGFTYWVREWVGCLVGWLSKWNFPRIPRSKGIPKCTNSQTNKPIDRPTTCVRGFIVYERWTNCSFVPFQKKFIELHFRFHLTTFRSCSVVRSFSYFSNKVAPRNLVTNLFKHSHTWFMRIPYSLTPFEKFLFVCFKHKNV